jgi:hypothetical protein
LEILSPVIRVVPIKVVNEISLDIYTKLKYNLKKCNTHTSDFCCRICDSPLASQWSIPHFSTFSYIYIWKYIWKVPWSDFTPDSNNLST